MDDLKLDDLKLDDLKLDDLKQRLQSHLQALVRERDPYLAQQGYFYAQHYIQQELGRWGTVQTHTFRPLAAEVGRRAREHTNFVLDLPAQAGRHDRPTILIGAHYDSVPGSPGADDDASGVAVLLELARLLQAQPARYPVQLVAFDLEEYDLLGSKAYVQALIQQQTHLRLMLSLEMVGYRVDLPNSQQYPPPLQYFYPDRGNFIGLVGNIPTLLDLIHLSRQIRQVGVPSCWLPAGWRGKMVPPSRLSDHAPFWDAGYRAILVTDTSFLRNPHYHQPSDRLETLDLEFMSRICQGLARGIQTL
jgi:hypothetical protein